MQFIFNSSIPRSGSELLQCLISQRKDVQASSTSPLLEYVYAASKNLACEEAMSLPEDVRRKSFYGFCREGMKGYAQESGAKKIWCDKSRGWIYYYPLLQKVLGHNPKMICMVRDLREVAASMEGLHRKNIEEGLIPDNNIITTEERVRQWIGGEPIGRALRRVKNALESHYEVLFVRYEDLCTDPAGIMAKIETYCDLSHFKYDFDKIKKSVNENEKAFGYNGVHQVAQKIRPITPKSVEILGPQITTEIYQSNLWYQTAFKYGA